jgi:hypothetical protein
VALRPDHSAIAVPEAVMPKGYRDFHAAFENKIKSKLKRSHDGWKDRLSNHEGFIDDTI